MTTTEITAHALALGITKEAFPEFWAELRFRRCPECEAIFHADVKFCNHHRHEVVRCFDHLERHCTLPDPLSDSPRCAIWEPFYMRALGWPHLYVDHAAKIAHRWICDGPWECFFTGATPTAALHAAFLAKGAKGC